MWQRCSFIVQYTQQTSVNVCWICKPGSVRVAQSLAVQDAQISRNAKADSRQPRISLSMASVTLCALVATAVWLVPISFVMIGSVWKMSYSKQVIVFGVPSPFLHGQKNKTLRWCLWTFKQGYSLGCTSE